MGKQKMTLERLLLTLLEEKRETKFDIDISKVHTVGGAKNFIEKYFDGLSEKEKGKNIYILFKEVGKYWGANGIKGVVKNRFADLKRYTKRHLEGREGDIEIVEEWSKKASYYLTSRNKPNVIKCKKFIFEVYKHLKTDEERVSRLTDFMLEQAKSMRGGKFISGNLDIIRGIFTNTLPIYIPELILEKALEESRTRAGIKPKDANFSKNLFDDYKHLIKDDPDKFAEEVVSYIYGLDISSLQKRQKVRTFRRHLEKIDEIYGIKGMDLSDKVGKVSGAITLKTGGRKEEQTGEATSDGQVSEKTDGGVYFDGDDGTSTKAAVRLIKDWKSKKDDKVFLDNFLKALKKHMDFLKNDYVFSRAKTGRKKVNIEVKNRTGTWRVLKEIAEIRDKIGKTRQQRHRQRGIQKKILKGVGVGGVFHINNEITKIKTQIEKQKKAKEFEEEKAKTLNPSEELRDLNKKIIEIGEKISYLNRLLQIKIKEKEEALSNKKIDIKDTRKIASSEYASSELQRSLNNLLNKSFNLVEIPWCNLVDKTGDNEDKKYLTKIKKIMLNNEENRLYFSNQLDKIMKEQIKTASTNQRERYLLSVGDIESEEYGGYAVWINLKNKLDDINFYIDKLTIGEGEAPFNKVHIHVNIRNVKAKELVPEKMLGERNKVKEEDLKKTPQARRK